MTGGQTLKFDMAATFLELGDATSCNLAYSQRKGVGVSYGEETITETNLLEIRRRHSKHVHLHMFSKHAEAQNGADWEWHIVGSRRTLKMRVQAKRVQRNEVLKIAHEVKSSGKQQRDLLIAGATAEKMKPVYCIYCTEGQREFWKQDKALPGFRSFETGCLLAGAEDVPQETKSLVEIEERCKPWHYLFLPGVLTLGEFEYSEVDAGDLIEFVGIRQPRSYAVAIDGAEEPADGSGWNVPTVDDLNEDTDREFDRIGVEETSEEDRTRLEPDTANGREMARWDEERLRELRLSRMMVVDVRNDSEADERRPMTEALRVWGCSPYRGTEGGIADGPWRLRPAVRVSRCRLDSEFIDSRKCWDQSCDSLMYSARAKPGEAYRPNAAALNSRSAAEWTRQRVHSSASRNIERSAAVPVEDSMSPCGER